MKCQVQWIDSTGKPTPDNNDAVMMAHFHTPIWGAPGPDNRIQGYSEEIQESFPICAVHYERVNDSFRPPRGGWTFTPITDEHANLIARDGWEDDGERERRTR